MPGLPSLTLVNADGTEWTDNKQWSLQLTDGGTPVTRMLIAAGFAYPEECADIPGECLFSAKELPVGKPIRFTVTPRDCFGLAGRPLVAVLSLA